jgi:hypothetical protein
LGVKILSKAARKPKHDIPEEDLYSELIEPAGDGGPVEAANFIAETVTDLAWLAGRHKLDLLCYLLSMTQLEAEELVKNRKKKPS